jgi:ketosteroid isomerase-like protein
VNKYFLVLSLIAGAALTYADARSEIKASFQKVEKAAMAKDIKGAEAAYKESVTSDFKYVQDGKTQDFKTFLANFTASIAMTDKVISHSTRIISLKESGNKAFGEIERKMTGTMKADGKKTQTFDWIGVFTEEYRKVRGKWKTATMTAGKQKFLVDGKPFKM